MARRAAGLAFVVLFAGLPSCSEIPTAPRVASVTVSGRITDRDGPPIANMFVTFRPAAPTPGIPSYTYALTGTDGRYTLKLMQGAYRMTVDPGYGAGYPSASVEGIKIGASDATVDYRYTGVRVSGSVTGLNGGSLSGASVTAYGDNAYATAQTTAGHYSILVPAGPYEMYADGGGSPAGLPQIGTGRVSVLSDTTIDFALTGFAMTATMSYTGGAPLIGAYLEAFGDEVSANAVTGLDGIATVYLPAGGYTIRAIPYPRNIVGPRSLSLSVQADDNVTFDFSGVRWDMTVRDAADGSPLVGARAVLRQVGGTEAALDDTDALGRSSFLVRPGVGYDLEVQWVGGTFYHVATVPNLFSAADTTFDISVSDPVAP